MKHRLRIGSLFAVLALIGSTALPLFAQVVPDGGSIRSRADLEALLVEYDQVLASPAYSNDLKAEARARAQLIRDRLQNGDFKLGDAVVLRVENEPTLPDTVRVQSGPDGPVITLPVFGQIPLRGVLRSEIEARITDALSQFIRDPVVQAEGLMRLSVQGAVLQPGFYVVPADMLISQALMVAGGPVQTAKLDELRIERGPNVLMEGTELQEELRLGTTLDQLNLLAGDQVVLPAETPGGWLARVGLIAGVLTSVTLLIVQVAR